MEETKNAPSASTASLLAARFANVDRISGFIASGSGRPLRFGVVGLVTFGVQIGLLLLFKFAGLGSLVAYALALGIAVQFNFVVNQMLVWQDRPLILQLRQFTERWVTFHGCIALSLVVNMGAFFVAHFFMPDVLAAVVGVGASTAIKFLSLDRLAFRAVQP